MNYKTISRRKFVKTSAMIGSTIFASRFLNILAHGQAPALLTSSKLKPSIPSGVQSGDVSAGRCVLWSQCDRPAQMIVEYATSDSFKDAKKITGSTALEANDFTARIDLSDLPADQQIFYRIHFEDLKESNLVSEPFTGSFRSAPTEARDVRFIWSGDCAGQGWGINTEWGGIKIFDAMRKDDPDFFIHSGDRIYADGVIKPEIKLPDGTLWKNIVTPAKSKVAETQTEFWGNFAYNFMDENVRKFHAQVPMIAQWDDHEVHNDWYPHELIEDGRFKEKNCDILIQRARKAFFDYTPIRISAEDPERIYRSYQYGPSLEVFMLDERSYRGANSSNRQEKMGEDTNFLGTAQLEWFKQKLKSSTATWKIIGSDMSIGLVVKGKKGRYDSDANGNGPVRGREFETADLLNFIKKNGIKNVVWLTADVHYAAAHYYNPSKAQYQDFDPFWEFVAGPLHAAALAPYEVDNTFGLEVKYTSTNKSTDREGPWKGSQYYGLVKIDKTTEVLNVALKDLAGKTLYSVDLNPERA